MNNPSTLDSLRRSLADRYWLRLHMAIMFLAATMSALAASRLMLAAGLDGMPLRYPLAIVCSYLVFFALLRSWLGYVIPGWHRRPRERGSSIDAPDFDIPGPAGAPEPHFTGYGGGDSGGGGASDSWDSAAAPEAPAQPTGSTGGGGSFLDLGDDLGLVLVALAALFALVTGCGVYLIYVAPELLPELALSALLGAALTRSAGPGANISGSWAGRAFRATIIPFTLLLVAAALLGYMADTACPTAARLADAWHCPL